MGRGEWSEMARKLVKSLCYTMAHGGITVQGSISDTFLEQFVLVFLVDEHSCTLRLVVRLVIQISITHPQNSHCLARLKRIGALQIF